MRFNNLLGYALVGIHIQCKCRIFMAIIVHILVFWIVKLDSLVGGYQQLGLMSYLDFHGESE
jgi:hypothetical protein